MKVTAESVTTSLTSAIAALTTRTSEELQAIQQQQQAHAQGIERLTASMTASQTEVGGALEAMRLSIDAAIAQQIRFMTRAAATSSVGGPSAGPSAGVKFGGTGAGSTESTF